jgi:hypothetical protein
MGRKLSLLNFASLLEEDKDEFGLARDLEFVKDYADVLKSYMAAVFLDSGNLI